MRFIPVFPKSNIFYMPSHNEGKVQNTLDDNDKFEPVENAPYV